MRRRELVGYRDRANRTHFGLTWRTGIAHLNGDALVDLLLCQSPLAAQEPGYLLLALIFEGVVADARALHGAWRAVRSTYRALDQVCLDWLDDDGRQQRRMLGALTVLSLRKQRRAVEFETALGQLLDALTAHHGFAHDIEALLSVARARLATALPGDLLAHVIDDHPLTAVPRSCMARLATQRALSEIGKLRASQGDLPTNVRAQVADALFAADSSRNTDDARRLVVAIARACRADSNEPSAVADRRRMLRELEQLAPECNVMGGWPCALWSWAVDLVERGTNRTQPLSPHTIDPYLSLTLTPLYSAVVGSSVDDIEALDWAALYTGIVEDPEVVPTQKGKVAAALTAWHEFLMDFGGAAALESPIDTGEQGFLPKANIVWPHEQMWIFEHLTAGATSSRFDAQLAALAAIAFSAAIRGEDIWHIHMFGVFFSSNGVTLHIDPLPSAGTGKSRNARRAIELAVPNACAALASWHGRRLKEGARPDDLLFGDPSQGDRPHRRGSTIAALNAWLKRATGDATVSTHTLRHSFLSLKRADLGSPSQRLLDEASAQAGHGSTQMSLDHYGHLYERLLRASLDELLMSRPMTERRACELSGLKPGCLRQRVHRRKHELKDLTALAWNAIDDAAAQVIMAAADDGFAMQSPAPLAAEDTSTLTLSKLLLWLGDLSAGVPKDVVTLRHGVESDQWRLLWSGILAWHRQAGRRASSLPASGSIAANLPFPTGYQDLAQAKVEPAVVSLKRTTNFMALAAAVDCWAEQLSGEHLSLGQPDRVRGLLQWMRHAGISGQQIVVCHEREREADGIDAAEVVEEVLLSAPSRRGVGHRAGRPAVYLMLRSIEFSARPCSNAAMSVSGLNALLFSAWLWQWITSKGTLNG